MPDILSDEELQHLLKRRHERPGDVFVELLEQEGLVVAPGVYNAMGAHVAERLHRERKASSKPCTFNAVYFGGWSVSAMDWRRPDMGFHDRTMMAIMAKYSIAAAYPLPVIVDAETGFGSAVTLTETVEEYHRLGVALAHMEDQDESKTRRCGNLRGKTCVEPEAMEAKIKSWLMTSYTLGTSMRLMVRTDALTAAGGGLENAIERGKRYMDVEYKGMRPLVLWVDAMHKPEEIAAWIEAMRAHDPSMILGINYSPNKDWTGYYRKMHNINPPTYDELHADGKGFRVIWHTILQSRADMEGTWDAFDDMAENGAAALWRLHERQRRHPVGDSQGMSNAPMWQTYEQMIGSEEAIKRYEKSEGYGKKE